MEKKTQPNVVTMDLFNLAMAKAGRPAARLRIHRRAAMISPPPGAKLMHVANVVLSLPLPQSDRDFPFSCMVGNERVALTVCCAAVAPPRG